MGSLPKDRKYRNWSRIKLVFLAFKIWIKISSIYKSNSKPISTVVGLAQCVGVAQGLCQRRHHHATFLESVKALNSLHFLSPSFVHLSSPRVALSRLALVSFCECQPMSKMVAGIGLWLRFRFGRGNCIWTLRFSVLVHFRNEFLFYSPCPSPQRFCHEMTRPNYSHHWKNLPEITALEGES